MLVSTTVPGRQLPMRPISDCSRGRNGHDHAFERRRSKGAAVASVQTYSCSVNSSNFIVVELFELTFRDAITVEQDSLRLLTRRLLNRLEKLLDHIGKIRNYFGTVGMNADGVGLARGTIIHGTAKCSNRRTVHAPGSRVGNISTKENGMALRDKGNLLWDDERDHSTELQVNLQTDAGTVLLFGLMDVFRFGHIGCQHQWLYQRYS